jgi:hypothetical protein
MDKFIKPIALSIKSPVFMDRESAKGLEPFQSVDQWKITVGNYTRGVERF